MSAKLRTFYTIVLTQTLSLIGSRISGLALGIWLFNETGNATPIALVAFFQIAPQVVMSSFAGVITDRWDRRYVMALSDFGQAIGTVLLLFLFASGSFQIWHLYLVTFIQSIFGVFQGPAFTASITMLVPDQQRNRANAIMQMTSPAAGIVAPAVAGLVFAAVGVIGAIVIDIVTFVIAFAVVLLVHIPRPRKTEEGAALSGSVWREMWSGLQYLWERKSLFTVMLFIMLLNFVFSAAGVLQTPYLLARLGDEALYGLAMSLFNGGMLAGGILVGIWGGTKQRVHTIMPAAILLGIFIMLYGMAQSVPFLMLISFLALIPNPFINALFMSILQAKVAPDVQGRVFAVISQLAMLMMPISMLMAGPLADQVFEPMVGTAAWTPFAPFFGTEPGAGIGLMFGISGLLSAVVSVVMYLNPSVRQLETSLPDYIPEPQPDEVQPGIVPA